MGADGSASQEWCLADGRLYSNLQKLREDGDYNCYIDVEQEDVEGYIDPTRQLIERIKQYILEK